MFESAVSWKLKAVRTRGSCPNSTINSPVEPITPTGEPIPPVMTVGKRSTNKLIVASLKTMPKNSSKTFKLSILNESSVYAMNFSSDLSGFISQISL